MQKVFRRSILARNQALRRQRRTEKIALKQTRHEIWQEQQMQNRDIIGAIRDERRHRREDWFLGPLAPRRDVGQDKDRFGTRTIQHSNAVRVEKSERVKYINFAVGDRVCVVRGRDEGKIGRVESVDEDSQTLQVQGVNQVDIQLLEFQLREDPGRAPFRTTELPISIHDVRLVIPIKDSTGQVRDVIVREMYGGGPEIERSHRSKLPKHTRYIGGEDTEVPWPEETLQAEAAEKVDTPRLHVEHNSWLPTLLRKPMPDGVIDELRNPYNRLRNDHEEEYLQKRILADLKENHKTRQKLVTPQTQYWEKMVEERANTRPSDLSADTLRLIAETQAATLGERQKGGMNV